MTLTLFAFAALAAATSATTEVNHLAQTDGSGRVVHMDVIHDEDAKTVMAIIGDVSQYANGIQTVNLHDYNTGYGVLKNINKKICLLALALVPMQPTWKYRVGTTNEVHQHYMHINQTEMTNEEVLTLAGPNIATFCHDYGTYYAVATPVARAKRVWCIFSRCIAIQLEYGQLSP
ncbi:uncharacterized protein LOC128214331 isoform X3 [Mya arenaria]|uniref:uncharacterized protein LOC128214331 isoform X3 n=1 Tax=Mya arenaria TaxID=6604 RepID=UPI0022E11B47|nr:uncharacterized protein LOC128214331 isoform X3 [Mya arenaria]